MHLAKSKERAPQPPVFSWLVQFTDTPSTSVSGILAGYTRDGIPVLVNQTGVRGFCSNEDAVIRFTEVGSAISGSEAKCAAYRALQ